MHKPVSFQLANLLKEKGFCLKVRSMYCEEKLHKDTNSKGNYNDVKWVRTWRNSPHDDILSAPTIAEVVDWFYTTHKIYVEARIVRDCFTGKWTVVGTSESEHAKGVHPSYHQAYEEVFEYLLIHKIKPSAVG